MSENGQEQEAFEAQVTDAVIDEEDEVESTKGKTVDKAIGRSRSRTRSRSRHRSSKYYRSRSRSRSRSRRSRRHRSRSYERYGKKSRHSRYREGRSHSRSPMSSRRRHQGNRENPTENKSLGVFGLSLYTTERDLRDVFEQYGTLEIVNVVYDHQTGRSRGFAFVLFANIKDACEAREQTDGAEVDGRRIRVDFSITERAHTPTPGVYMGKPTRPRRESREGYRESYRERGYHRSPSPYYRRTPSPHYYRRSPSPHYFRRSPSPYYRGHRRSHHYPRDRSFSPSRY